MQIYVVQRGDSLWRIASQYGVNVNEIAALNGITDPNQVLVGESLVIPTSDSTYVVQPGDSLWSIARRYGTTVQELIRLNAITQPSVLNAGTRLRVPTRSKPTIDANHYFTDFGQRGASLVTAHGDLMTYATPFSNKVTATGDIQAVNDAPLRQAARAQRVAPLLCITNYVGAMFNSDLARTVMSSDTISQRVIDNALQLIETKGYRGINIDFEYLYPADRQLYNNFLRKVATQMHARGYLVSTALAPKNRADQPGLLYIAHDYPVHGELCDFVVLMTYEWGWAGGPPPATNLLHVFTGGQVVMELS